MSPKLLAMLACAAFAVAPAAQAQTPATEPAPAPPTAEPAAPAATPAPAAKAETAKPAAAPASSGVAIPAPPAGKGQIVFFRPGRFIGAAVSWKLLDGTTELGKVANAHYFVATLEPGAHDLVMDFGTKGKLHMEVDPDETYYIECGIQMGAILNHPDLIPSNQDGFGAIAAKLKPTKPK